MNSEGVFTAVLAFLATSNTLRRFVRRRTNTRNLGVQQTLWGWAFENPIGILANRRTLLGLEALGAGFLEIRAVECCFNTSRRLTIPLFITIGGTKDTPDEVAPSDYATSLKRVWNLGDLFVIRADPHTLGEILPVVRRTADRLPPPRYKPAKQILIELTADMTEQDRNDTLGVAVDARMDGIVVADVSSDFASFDRVCRTVGAIRRGWASIPIIASGCLDTSWKAYDVLVAGANLLLISPEIVFRHQLIPRRMAESIVGSLDANMREGIASLSPQVNRG